MLTMRGSWLFFVSLEMLLTLKILDYATKSMVFPSIQLLWEKYSIQFQMIKNIFEAGIRVFIHIYLSGYMKCTCMHYQKEYHQFEWNCVCLSWYIYDKNIWLYTIYDVRILIIKRYSLVVWFALIDATIALARAISFVCATGGIFSLSNIIDVFWSILEWLVPVTLEFFEPQKYVFDWILTK